MEILRKIREKKDCWFRVSNIYRCERNGEMVSLCPHKGRGSTHPNAHKTGMRCCVVCVTMMRMAHSADRSGDRKGK